MLILASPAKRQDFESDWHSHIQTFPHFLDESAEIVDTLKQMSTQKLRETLDASAEITESAERKYQSWQKNHSIPEAKPAILAYTGDVFSKLSANNYSKSEQEYAQKSLRIVSGLYGLLRPYDQIQPYRLEMNTKLKTEESENLYQFWDTKLTDWLNLQILNDQHKLLVNVASKAYSKAIQFDQLDCKILHIDFQQVKNGKQKNIMLYTKHARGLMIEYLIKNQIESLEDIKRFSSDGYFLEYEDESQLIFLKDLG